MQKHEDWLKFAHNDLKAAKILLDGKLRVIATFHTQQAAEKALKAFIIFKKLPFNKTHDLVILINQCLTISPTFYELIELGFELNPYVIDGRYPQPKDQPSLKKVRQAINFAEEIVDRSEVEIAKK